MSLSGISIDRVTVTALPSDLDATTERCFADRFKDYVAGARLLHVITLDDEEFEPSSLAFLLRLGCIVRDAGGAVCLVTSRQRTKSVLSATRMDRMFKTFSSVDAAIAFLAPLARKLSA